MKKIYLYTVLISLLTCFTFCSNDDVIEQVDDTIPQLDIDNLREAPVKMGGAINVNALRNDAQYREIVIREFSSVTAENAMKMRVMSKGRGQYDFTDADYLVDFARENNMRVHGHTLIWHQETPVWIENFRGDKEEWKEIMREYIHDVVTHFKGKVESWDVVNEVLLDEGVYRQSVWYENIGEEFVELAFRYAHEADPNAILFYNDYGHEYSHTKHVALNNMIDDLLEKETPIHGIGMQMHIHVNQQENRLKYPMRAVVARNLLVHVSELDVAMNPDKEEDFVYTGEVALKQQEIYRYMAEGMMDVPENLRFGITFWGVTDQYSWLYEIPDWPLPFSDAYEKKPAYTGLLQGFYR